MTLMISFLAGCSVGALVTFLIVLMAAVHLGKEEKDEK